MEGLIHNVEQVLVNIHIVVTITTTSSDHWLIRSQFVSLLYSLRRMTPVIATMGWVGAEATIRLQWVRVGTATIRK